MLPLVLRETRGDVGVVREQQLDDLRVTEERREVQRRPAVGAVLLDRRGIVASDPLDALELAGGARLEDRQRRAARDEQVHNFLLAMIDSG